jgi:hypothetical protein
LEGECRETGTYIFYSEKTFLNEGQDPYPNIKDHPIGKKWDDLMQKTSDFKTKPGKAEWVAKGMEASQSAFFRGQKGCFR